MDVPRVPSDAIRTYPRHVDPLETRPATVQRVETPRGELVLRRCGADYEIISNGTFLMDTRDGASERLLARSALAGRPGPVELLLGGLGVGFSLHEALQYATLRRVTVLEVEPAVIEWHRTYLRAVSGAALADPRVEVICSDLLTWLRGTHRRFDAVCVDVDNGPEWTVRPDNAALYGERGLELLESALRPGGTLAVWSAHAAPAFAARFRRRFIDVGMVPVEVARGEPDLIYHGRRAAGRAQPGVSVSRRAPSSERTSSRTSTPRPGPSGTGSPPSSRTNGRVTSTW